MKITTREFALTSRGYFKALLTHALHYFVRVRQILLLGGCFVVIAVLVSVWFSVIFATLCPVWVVIQAWFQSRSKTNRIFFKEKWCEIDDEFLTTHGKDGSLGKMPLSDITSVLKTRTYYSLYISTTQFIYVSVSAFVSEEDRDSFDRLLRSKKLL